MRGFIYIGEIGSISPACGPHLLYYAIRGATRSFGLVKACEVLGATGSNLLLLSQTQLAEEERVRAVNVRCSDPRDGDGAGERANRTNNQK